jgi:hypothetical protein
VPISLSKNESSLFLIYPNLGTKITKYEIAIIEIKNKIKRKTILIPDVKIKTDQLKRTKSVCPKSGCKTKSKTTIKVIVNVKKYFKYKFEYFSLDNIRLMEIIKNGLTISIG